MDRIIKKAPRKGFAIICLKDQLIFAPYEIRDGVFLVEGWDCPDLTTAEECHFFNDEQEYRRIYRSSRQDVIETLLTASEEQDMDPDLIYREEVLVKPTYAKREGLPSKLIITSRYGYSEYDMLVLADYRISYAKP